MNTEQKLKADFVEIRRIDTMRTIELSDPIWQTARPVPITRYWSGKEAPRSRHSEARLLWSDVALHVRFVSQQEEPLIVSADPLLEHKTLGLWDRDVSEMFVAPDLHYPEQYFEFEAAPTGEWIDLSIKKTSDSRSVDWEFRSGMTTQSRIDADKITIGINIPWGAFGCRPEIDTRWRGNLTRCVGDGASRGYLAWQPTYTERPDFHVPEVFGEMIFIS